MSKRFTILEVKFQSFTVWKSKYKWVDEGMKYFYPINSLKCQWNFSELMWYLYSWPWNIPLAVCQSFKSYFEPVHYTIFYLKNEKKENVFNYLQITHLMGFILKWFQMHVCWCFFSVNIFDKFTDTWTTEIFAWTLVCFFPIDIKLYFQRMNIKWIIGLSLSCF